MNGLARLFIQNESRYSYALRLETGLGVLYTWSGFQDGQQTFINVCLAGALAKHLGTRTDGMSLNQQGHLQTRVPTGFLDSGSRVPVSGPAVP